MPGTIAVIQDVDEDKNYESISLLWLDANVNTSNNNLITQKKLRAAVNFLRTFNNPNDCAEWMQRRQVTAADDKIILIVSGELGRDFVPEIHELPQLIAVFVYCMDKVANEQWAKNHSKVLTVLTDSNELVSVVKSNQEKFQKLEELSSLPLSVYDSSAASSSKTENSSSGLNGDFLWFQFFIEVLLRMDKMEEDRQELVQLCQKTQAGNATQLQIVKEFEEMYHPGNAAWWYTRQSCIYRMLNKALRCQDLDTLLAFRSFITDLFRQLNDLQNNADLSSLQQLYRGQLMSKQELDRMKSSVGKYISMNSFLSTTLDRQVAVRFLRQPKDGLGPVLFEIEIDPLLQDAKPFADIAPSQTEYRL
ncbi:unnamed protein product [Didymodactylos carnosus]|uniref:Uncharacterized protein n=1 Tax=Didymodactylos carnosus TaxID=1234261 RepID=A0A8S2UK58_9BILA|nr:unnamed protein product [Didymodactylos carnosus]CAF4320011.1 unnamed protein product [Didymodactylos carnosus]